MLQSLLLAATMLAQGAQAPDPRHAEDIKHDQELGKKYSEEVAKEYKVSENKEYVARVERIGQEMAAIARVTNATATWGDKRLSPFDYHFMVIKGDDVNAFSLPGGYIYVFEGLVKYIETDEELAGVLAHEISHAAFRHVAMLQREQGKVESITLPLVLIAILTQGASSGAQAMTLGNLVGLATGSGWSLKAELAADYGGFQYLTKSKYNPTAMLTVMERLARDERNSPRISLGILQSHPPSRERADAIIKEMADAHLPVQRSAVTTSLRATAKPGDKGSIEIWFAGRRLFSMGGDDALKRADAIIPKLNVIFDQAPALYEMRREGNQILFRGSPILELNETDAASGGLKLDEASKEAFKSLQNALYVLSFRIWDQS